MDLWDVVKLLARRWYASVPLLAVSLASAVWVGFTTEPDYVATSHVSLLPPTVREDTASSRNVNPWTVDTLIGAVVTRLNGKAQHDAAKAAGLSPVWEAGTDPQFRGLIALEVTAQSEEQARATTHRLHELIVEEVAAQQERYKLRPGEDITAAPIAGDDIVPARSKIYRSMIAIAGAGIILTMGFVIGLDALLRWRSRRRRSGAPRSVPVEEQGILRRLDPSAAVPASPAPARVPAVSPAGSGPTEAAAVVNGAGNGSAGPANGTSADTTVLPSSVVGEVVPTVAMELVVTSVETTDAPPPSDHRTAGKQPVTSEATIVLPLSNAPWVSRDERRRDRDR